MRMRRMYINGKCVGSGMWSLDSVKNYCQKKGIELRYAESEESTLDWTATDRLDLQTGEYTTGPTRTYEIYGVW